MCTECECVRPGVNVCQGQVVVLAMDQLYLPGWCPPKPRPSYVPTSTNTIQRANYPRCVPCTMRASVPSGGVQLGVGELVSALAAPSPLIAGANTILAIYFHFPILTSSCPCRSLCRLQASAASWTPPTSPRGSSSSGGAVEATSDMSCWEARSSIRR